MAEDVRHVPVAGIDDLGGNGSARTDAVAEFADLTAERGAGEVPVARFDDAGPSGSPAGSGAASGRTGALVTFEALAAGTEEAAGAPVADLEAVAAAEGPAAVRVASFAARRGRGGAGPVVRAEPRADDEVVAAPAEGGRRSSGGGRRAVAFGARAGGGRPDPRSGADPDGDLGPDGSGGRPTGPWRSGRGGAAEPDPDADPRAVARDICLRLLTDRARTRQELAQALRRKGVPDDAAEAVLGRFDEVGLVDDAAFAEQWVRSRHAVRGLGRRALAVELRRKGVADELASEALDTIDRAAEERRARELVDRKLRTAQAGNPEQRATLGRRLVGMLARKGYPAGVAYTVVREALAEHGAEPDELAADLPED